jgi:Fe-S cluster biogenesis protein NfuA
MQKNKAKLLKQVNDAIDQLRPYLQSDGGDVEVVEITGDMIVKLRFLGSCVCCPFNVQTLKAGIEQTLRKEIPEIKQVVAL